MAETLAEKQAKSAASYKVAEVERMGEKIILPEKMTPSEAIKHLERVVKYEEETVNPSQAFDAFPWDGAQALTTALTKLFGWYSLEKTPGFFGSTPPAMIDVETGPGTSVKVPWGRFCIPPIPQAEGYLQTSYTTKNNRIVFQLTGAMRRKYEGVFQQICDEIKRELAEHSIYKGKAFSIRFNNDNGTPLELPEIHFIDLNREVLNNLVLSRSVERQVITHVFTPIEKHALLKQLGISFKRGTLLAGKFGTGKTLISTAAAIKCVDNGITFILCSRAEEFAQTLDFARQYAKSLVFCEDIDRVAGQARTLEINDLLNTLDGVESKKSEVAAVFTTNNAEAIQQAMMRPGRIDAAFEVTPPDAEAVTRLIQVYAKGMLAPKTDLSGVGKALAGEVPAVIQECVQRSKLYALSQSTHPRDIKITGEDLLAAAEGMAMQLDLLNGKRTAEVHPSVLAGHLIGKHLAEAIRHVGSGLRQVQPEFAKVANEEVKELTATVPTFDEYEGEY